MDLWRDLLTRKNNVVRLMFRAFERDQFRVNSQQGRRLLHAMLNVLPDNKIVEDAHNDIRKYTRITGCMKKRSLYRLQHVLMHERLFEKRQIKHNAAITREWFESSFQDTLAATQGHRFKPQTHEMPTPSFDILGRKVWQTIAETTLRTDIAAWTWLQVGHALAATPQGPISLSAARFSKLALSGMLLQRLSNDWHFLCLGNASWAAMVWPCKKVEMDDTMPHVPCGPTG